MVDPDRTDSQTVPAAIAARLVEAKGLARLAVVVDALDAGQTELQVGSDLRTEGLDAPLAALMVEVAQARRRARARWPDADELVFTRAALEQASDPAVSAWRAMRFAADSTATQVWDLCASVGGDALAFAARGLKVVGVDHDAARLAMLAHNASVRGLAVRIVEDDALRVVTPANAWVHADPSRRHGGRRHLSLDALQPPPGRILAAHGHARGIGIVLPAGSGPHVDGPLADCEIEYVQLGRRMIEATAWWGACRVEGAATSATLIEAGNDLGAAPVHLRRHGPPPTLPVRPVGALLVTCAPAAVRARLHTTVGAEIDAWRIDERRALLSTDVTPPPSPWYDARPVEAVLPARPRLVRTWLQRQPELPLEIALHGVDTAVDTWWRALGRPGRGPDGRRLELVRTSHGAQAIVTVSNAEATGS